MRWIVLYNPDNNKKKHPSWRVELLHEYVEQNVKALLSKNLFCDWRIVSNVFKSFDEALSCLDELKYRKDLNDNIKL